MVGLERPVVLPDRGKARLAELRSITAMHDAILDRVDAGAAGQAIPNADAPGETTAWLSLTLLPGDDALIDEVIAAFRRIATAWR